MCFTYLTNLLQFHDRSPLNGNEKRAKDRVVVAVNAAQREITLQPAKGAKYAIAKAYPCDQVYGPDSSQLEV